MFSILIVGGNLSVCTMWRDYLEQDQLFRCKVVILTCMDELWDYLQAQKPDCLLLDDPVAEDLDYAAVLSALDTQDFKQNMAIIVLSERDDMVVAVNAMKLGAQDFLLKGGLTPDRLKSSVQEGIALKRRMDSALKASETNWRNLANMMPAIVWVCEPEGGVIFHNDQWVEYTGIGLEASLGFGYMQVVHPEDVPHAETIWIEARRNLKTYECELRLRRSDGEYRWFMARAYPILNEQGEVMHWYGTSVDVHDRKMADEALRKSEARFRQVLSANMLGVAFGRRDGAIVEANDALLNMLGYSREELNQGQLNWRNLTPPEFLERDRQFVDNLALGGGSSLVEKQYVHKDGHRVDVMRGLVRLSEDPHEGVAFILDISEKKRIERVLQESEARFRTMAEAAPMMIWLLDTQGRWTYVNKMLEDFFGKPAEELLSENFYRFIHPDDRQQLGEMMSQAISSRSLRFRDEMRVLSADGTYRWILGQSAARLDSEGRIIGYIGSGVDINARKTMEIELRQAKEIAEEASRKKSEFLAMMSHELRTPLNSIIGYSRMLEKGMAGPLNGRQQDYLGNVNLSGQHLLSLINDLLDVSKVEAGRMEIAFQRFKLAPLLAEVEGMMRQLGESRQVSLFFELDPALDVLEADPARFKQILLNLITNAIKFNHERGLVWVRLFPSVDGLNLVCEVEDTGIGMPPDKLPELFKKFYQVDNTAARQHEGTGLGLALSKDLIEMHGGEIFVDSKLGIGTTFRFKIPRFHASTSAEAGWSSSVPGE